ncbi:MAG: M28 family peptidase, partial [Acidobacteriota bacterium]
MKMLALLACLLTLLAAPFARAQTAVDDVTLFASLKDRSSGSEGAERAADYILKSFEQAGLSNVGAQKFLMPVPQVLSCSMEAGGESMEIHPWGPNLVYLPMTPVEGLDGPLVYAGNGSFAALDGHEIKDSIVLMDMDSGAEWLNTASYGAKALVYLGNPKSIRGEFERKNTLTPMAFPRYWVDPQTAERLKHLASTGTKAVVKSRTVWQNKLVRNCYGLIPGRHPELKRQLIVLDAFYDASSHVLGTAPGADESASIAVLLSLARKMAQSPPDRSVLFLATVGNGQALSGMRQFIHVATARKKILRKEIKQLQESKERIDRRLDLIGSDDPIASAKSPEDQEILRDILVEEAKNRADTLIREIQYQKAVSGEEAASGVEEPRPYRRLSWLTTMKDLTAEQRPLALKLIKETVPGLKAAQKDLRQRQQAAKSGNDLRNVIDEYTPVLYLDLYLSSLVPELKLVEMGGTYPVRGNLKRMTRSARLTALLGQLGSETARETGLPDLFARPDAGSAASSENTAGMPGPCCDVAVLAGLPAVALMTVDDFRPHWSTPHDTLENVNLDNVELFTRYLSRLFGKLFSHATLHGSSESGLSGLAGLEGQAMFIRQGELFPDQPAPGTVVSV